MSKITERKCSAIVMPVELWDKQITTWDQLQQACDDMDVKSKCRAKSDRYTNVPNTLKLTDLDSAVTLSHLPTRHLDVDDTAEYYIDLYPVFWQLGTDGLSVRAQLAQKRPFVCPHLDLMDLMSRPMSSHPVDFRPNSPSHGPHATVADVLCRTLENAPWRADPAAPYQRQDKPQRRIKEQTIWCGFKGIKCRTAVSLQRFRGSSGENSVGGLLGLSDLCRIKFVRRWRVDCGTDEEEGRAQSGVSTPAALSAL
ncbi:hypothetical protein SVAN01_01818 [Stagonosporopsis vannaccii]|nr:hypothetical protein SVAN01_01818 [Stagonosporopsis vannaccii]